MKQNYDQQSNVNGCTPSFSKKSRQKQGKADSNDGIIEPPAADPRIRQRQKSESRQICLPQARGQSCLVSLFTRKTKFYYSITTSQLSVL